MKKQKLLACLTALCMTVTAFAPIAQPVQAQTDVETAEHGRFHAHRSQMSRNTASAA